jgi:thiol-disulfide isomerase/thioredoxin
MDRRTHLRAWLGLGMGTAFGCAGATREERPGKLSDLSSVDGPLVLCDHRVPEATCVLHHPELVAKFKRAGDWCAPHEVPESQCHLCHPDLVFRPLPKLPTGADVAWLAKDGEDVGDLTALAVKGKVTVFEFYADWCNVCRNVDHHLYGRIASGDASFAYRKLNVVDWDTPLGKRYLTDVPGLPLIVVHRPDGTPSARVFGADLALIDRTIAAAAAP